MRKIRVLVVEDSLVFSRLLVQCLNEDPALEVVAVARDPYEARDAILAHRPDVMTLDIELPKMSGIEFLQKLMPQYPVPTVVISSLSDKVFDALQAGAVDFVAKPVVSRQEQLEAFLKTELPLKIKIASTAKMSNIKKIALHQKNSSVRGAEGQQIIAIGASTGGPEATSTVLKEFGPDIPGVVVVQHMPAGFTGMYAQRLDNNSRVRVKEAQDGDRVLPGQVLVAPAGERQTRVVRGMDGYRVEIKPGERVSGHCPSVDVLFQSVAKAAGSNAIGIILTGMGGDGAKGLLEMRNAGAKTIGQDESTCVIYGMPKVAYEMGAVQYQEKLTDIAKKTYSLIKKS